MGIMTIIILMIVLIYFLKVVRREICAMVTKGTLTEGEALLANPEPSYILSVAEDSQYSSKKSQDGHTIGVCIIDVSTSKFIVGQVSGFMIPAFVFKCTYAHKTTIKLNRFLESRIVYCVASYH